jgi:AraC-like DNA-binding protein
MVFHLGEPFAEVCGERAQTQGRALFAGQLTGPLFLRSSTKIGCFAVRFTAGGISQFTRLRMNQFNDLIVDVQDVFEGSAAFSGRMLAAATFEERVAIAEDFLLRQLRPGDPVVAQALYRLESSAGTEPVLIIAKDLNLTARHLERRFAEDVGLSPKIFARIVRFQRALRLLESGNCSGAEVAYETGFSDQAHLIRDFVQFAGIPPTTYLRQRLELFAPTR